MELVVITHLDGTKTVHSDIYTAGWGENQAINLDKYFNAYSAKVLPAKKACEVAEIDFEKFKNREIETLKSELPAMVHFYGKNSIDAKAVESKINAFENL